MKRSLSHARVRKNNVKAASRKPASLASLTQLKAEGFTPRFTPAEGRAEYFTYMSPAGEKTVHIPTMYEHVVPLLMQDSPNLRGELSAKKITIEEIVTRKRVDQGLHTRRAKVDELRKVVAKLDPGNDTFTPIEVTVKGPKDVAYIGVTVPQRLEIAQEYAGPSVCLGAYIGNNPNQPYVGMWFRKHCWAFCEGGRKASHGVKLPKLPGIELLDEVVSYDNGKPHPSEQDFADAIALAKKWLPVSEKKRGIGSDEFTKLNTLIRQNTFDIGVLRDASAWLQIQREEASAKPGKLLPGTMTIFTPTEFESVEASSVAKDAKTYLDTYDKFKALIDEKVESYPPHQRAAKFKSLWRQVLSKKSADAWLDAQKGAVWDKAALHTPHTLELKARRSEKQAKEVLDALKTINKLAAVFKSEGIAVMRRLIINAAFRHEAQDRVLEYYADSVLSDEKAAKFKALLKAFRSKLDARELNVAEHHVRTPDYADLLETEELGEEIEARLYKKRARRKNPANLLNLFNVRLTTDNHKKYPYNLEFRELHAEYAPIDRDAYSRSELEGYPSVNSKDRLVVSLYRDDERHPVSMTTVRGVRYKRAGFGGSQLSLLRDGHVEIEIDLPWKPQGFPGKWRIEQEFMPMPKDAAFLPVLNALMVEAYKPKMTEARLLQQAKDMLQRIPGAKKSFVDEDEDAATNPRKRPRRNARPNPLVGWDYVGEPFDPKTIDRATRPMFSPSAPQVYAEKLKTTKLPIHVVIGGFEEQRHVDDLIRRGRTVLWLQQTLGTLFRFVGQDVAEIMSRKRGERGRVSPMTPFTLLHRMGDALRRAQYHQLPYGEKERDDDDIGRMFDLLHYTKPNIDFRRLYSSGVGTQAGREGWFTSWREAISDLWAKYLLTGKIDYDPEAPPLDTGATRGGRSPEWSKEELEARRSYSEKLHHYFPKWLKASKGAVFVISE